MIASFSRGFVFIKTRKTAGTSIEIALSRFCGEGDIITPIAAPDEIVRHQHGGRLPQNYCKDRTAERRLLEAIQGGDVEEIKDAGRVARKTRRFRNHMPARAVERKVPDRFWRSAFKFTIDRHPYEKAVSLAYYGYEIFARNGIGGDFDTFLDDVVRRGKYRNFGLYSKNGIPVIDEILKYEEIPDCFLPLKERTGIDISSILPRTKHHQRKPRTPAIEILSDRQKETIQHICEQEFDFFDYEK